MSLIEEMYSDDIHPIDLCENLAEFHEWEFDRVADDQIALTVEGQWRNYAITLAWSDYDETLRIVCTFEMEPPEERLANLYELLNLVNDQVWTGSFTYWHEQRLMVYRYGLVLAGGQIAGTEQVNRLISASVGAAERFYPAFQLIAWSDRTAKDAIEVAITEAYGRA